MKYDANKIYSTTDYTIFKRMTENRDVSDGRRNKIRKSIEQVQLRAPIKVNEKMEIIDGQGRFEALKELGLPVEFFVAPGESVRECIQMNKVGSKWTMLDYIDSYAKGGNVNYINMKRMISAHPEFPATLVARTICSTHRASEMAEGRLLLEGEQLVKAETALEILSHIAPLYHRIKGRKDVFCAAFVKCVGYGMDAVRLTEKIGELEQINSATMRENIQKLEDIYNKNLPAGKRVFVVSEFDKEIAGVK